MLTKSQLHILQHTLGLNQYGKDPQGGAVGHRNHFVAGEGHSEYPIIADLVLAGYMVKRSPCAVTDHWFSVTDAGRAAVQNESPKPPKLSRSKQRYKRYLEFGDGFDSFIEFCRWDARPENSWNAR
jgi:hypothetical protein